MLHMILTLLFQYHLSLVLYQLLAEAGGPFVIYPGKTALAVVGRLAEGFAKGDTTLSYYTFFRFF